ncbi:HAD family phosphatase [Nocardioides sp. CER19]|uniref:HAD family hydrolase n=1 Tax=Nocardioides sp. CER19 TaxID=3038538 RepID=UPI002447710A|nr:HAD family phosphatase [Nocardioides sp. CER19]MDH2416127.1 HAD family phosphatase [Nocardioides sp. CER19]
MTAPAPQAILFDYGGVLTTPVSESIAAWLTADGIEPTSFSRVLKAWLGRTAPSGTPIHRLETGDLSIPDFDALLAAELSTLDGSPVKPVGVLQRLFARMQPDSSMFELVAQLRESGLKVALVSNSWGNTYPRQRIDASFDEVVISGEVGLRKPDAAIYRLALGRLGVEPSNAIFVDDAEPNVEGARAIGMPAILHTDPAATRTALAEALPHLININEPAGVYE